MQELEAEDKKAPFTWYREGYIDGYVGRPVQAQHNTYYMQGYVMGDEDDRQGIDSKFEIEISNMNVACAKPF
mgnify:CR=1 FL=1